MPKRNIPKTNKPAPLKKPPSVVSETSTSLSQTGVALDDSCAQQIEQELCWCIQQLQTALTCTNSKMNPRQCADALKSLNVLKNNTVSLVKKRQVMRSTFGDYRAKMAEEEKLFRKANTQCKIEEASPNKNSRFLKKSAVASAGLAAKKFESTDNSFRFNFSLPNEVNDGVEDITTKQQTCAITN